ncbi:hypothetical protein AU195_09155 [Mycobacterium sp. IS-1496]|uniref:hypothetical protein n=1 Tax=Mycobacterium sp. IS-1496 TaxID=1772284 RepID=UPI00074164A3|nr:hypothetical protein [Mycobacterium sp. IS-1496]KUI34681.1 hypothetical protein AU195_09155 [Mycobacterium sp. IS-1496]
MSNVSVSPIEDGSAIGFVSDDESFYLRSDGTWWAIDVVNDRGRRYNDIARFSTFDLAEKFLIWRWGSTMRDVLGAKISGPELYKLGRSADVVVLPTENEWLFELQSEAGTARLSEPQATIFSHLMLKPVDEIEQMVKHGVS